jgi:hypothetical protein
MSFLDFFRVEADEERPPREPPAECPPRPWFAPPEDELGVSVPLGLIVARSEKGVLAVPHATVYSTGVQFDFVAQARGLSRRDINRLFHEQHQGFGDDEEEELSDGFLRLGIELPGGARVSNLPRQQQRLFRGEVTPDGPVLMMHGGGGGMATDQTASLRPGCWIWPLPEPGILLLSCEWPIVEISLCTVEIEATRLHEAAQRVIQLWPS